MTNQIKYFTYIKINNEFDLLANFLKKNFVGVNKEILFERKIPVGGINSY